MHVEADAAGALGHQRALLQGVVNPLDAVGVHRQQEAAANHKLNSRLFLMNSTVKIELYYTNDLFLKRFQKPF